MAEVLISQLAYASTESFPPASEDMARKDHDSFVGTGVADQTVKLEP